MKKLTFLMSLVVLCNLLLSNCKNNDIDAPPNPTDTTVVDASKFIPRIVRLGNQWNELASYGVQPWPIIRMTYVTTIEKDTLIQGKTYYKLITARDSLSSVWENNGYFREDTVNKRVYQIKIGNPERLLYDFRMQESDSIVYDYPFGIHDSVRVVITAKSVDSILIGKYWCKRISVHVQLKRGVDELYTTNDNWIEGVGGSSNGLLQDYIANSAAGGVRVSALLCFFQQARLVYKPLDTGIKECYVWLYRLK